MRARAADLTLRPGSQRHERFLFFLFLPLAGHGNFESVKTGKRKQRNGTFHFVAAHDKTILNDVTIRSCVGDRRKSRNLQSYPTMYLQLRSCVNKFIIINMEGHSPDAWTRLGASLDHVRVPPDLVESSGGRRAWVLFSFSMAATLSYLSSPRIKCFFCKDVQRNSCCELEANFRFERYFLKEQDSRSN